MTAPSTSVSSTSFSLLNRVDLVLRDEDWTASDSLVRPAHAAVSAALPAGLLPTLKQRLSDSYPQGIYRHQALALDHILTGVDIALTTPTASGKSLVFITGALQILLADPLAKVVALYPMKALGNDQLAKWKSAMESSALNVAVLDGDVKVKDRERLLQENQVLIMTPDVLHTWLMANLHSPVVRHFREQMKMVILDEAHVYDGVFGTSTAYLMRRLDACGPHFQLIASSATIGQVDTFLTHLTGRNLTIVGADTDGSPRHEVAWRSITPPRGNAFNNRVELLMGLAEAGIRFIAFADSRKSAELLASATRRGAVAAEPVDDEFIAEAEELLSAPGILPYRSGIEAKDRQRIEAALASGELRGVIATSALELGVDIPGIHCVVLMGSPPTQKSLWQRAGRTGRHGEGCVMLMQDAGSFGRGSLTDYLARPIEANHLSLENRSLEFAHVLCATVEAEACGVAWNASALSGLSPRFHSLLEMERAGGQVLEQELWDLKSKAGGSPHRTFSLRSGKETNFEIILRNDRIGSISFPQVMRETYPGAIYYHLAT
ncbi:MAG: ATP-dependent helicase, partial [Verrucomicrobiales bacterium]|nr:ATP-dependent helicase [Verrucomicrobiales bacterium]